MEWNLKHDNGLEWIRVFPNEIMLLCLNYDDRHVTKDKWEKWFLIPKVRPFV